MNANQKLKQIIEVILGKTEVKQVSAKLVDGTEVSFEVLEVGAEVYVVTEEGNVLAPDGTHEIEGGLKIETKDGIITSIIEPETEEATEEVVEEQVAQENANPYETKIAELETKIAKLEEAIVMVAQKADEQIEKVEQSVNEKPATTKTKIEVEQSKGKIRKSIYDFINK
jgi:hypothetical protein